MELNFDWHEDYSIGVDEIDSQHKRFLMIVKNIVELDDHNIKDDVVVRMLDELLRYAKFHFQSEELLMISYEYPKLYEQRKEHEKIMIELSRRVLEIKESGADIKKMLHFLVQWFINHTTYSDKGLGAYINNCRMT